LDDQKQAGVLLELMSYLYPKRKMIEHAGFDGDSLRIQHTRISLKRLISLQLSMWRFLQEVRFYLMTDI
jgi:hypothetical protein